jgi:O-antigen/teichoic acid export membrane protein
MIFCVPIVIGTYVIAKPLMVFVAGQDFAESGAILKVLILASAAIFGTSMWGYALIAVEKQRTITWAYGTAAFLTFAGYLYFIPKFGYWGAAWMTVFSEVLIMVWSAIVLYLAIKFFPSLKIFIKTIPAALIMAGAIYFLPQWHVFFQLLISGLIYFPVLYLFGGFEKETVMAIVRRTPKI